MGLISLLKGIFGVTKKENTLEKSEVKSTNVVEVKEQTIDTAVEETKVIKDRMVEVSEKKEETKVTAKDIKGKSSQGKKLVEKQDTKPANRPAKKQTSKPSPKPTTKQTSRPPRKKTNTKKDSK